MKKPDNATEQAQRYWDKQAPGYDREMGFYEKLLFKGARTWACSRAQGDVLEIAVGTGRNLEFYPPETQLTGIELSPNMLAIAQGRRAESMPPPSSAWEMRRSWSSPTGALTRSYAPSRCARSPTMQRRSER